MRSCLELGLLHLERLSMVQHARGTDEPVVASNLQSKNQDMLAGRCSIKHCIVKQLSTWPHFGLWHSGSENGGYGNLSTDLLLAQRTLGSQHLQQVCALLRTEQPGQLAQQGSLLQACNTSSNPSQCADSKPGTACRQDCMTAALQ